MLKFGGYSAQLLLINAFLCVFINYSQCATNSGSKYKGAASPRFDAASRNTQKRLGIGKENVNQGSDVVNETLSKINTIAQDGRIVLLVCRQKCARQRTELPRWIHEFNVEYNTSASEDPIEHHFHPYRIPIKQYGIEDRLRTNGVAILYLVGGRVFYFTGDSTNKATIWKWLLSFERVNDSPRFVKITNDLDLDACINRATIFCRNKTRDTPTSIDLMIEHVNDTVIGDGRYEYILEPATALEKRRLYRMEIEAKRAKSAKNSISVNESVTVPTAKTIMIDPNVPTTLLTTTTYSSRPFSSSYRKKHRPGFYDWKSKFAKFSAPTGADPTVNNKINANNTSITTIIKNARSDNTDNSKYSSQSLEKHIQVKANSRRRRTTLNFSRTESVEADFDNSSWAQSSDGGEGTTGQKVLLIVHHLEQCPELRLANLVRALRDNALITVAEARRPLSAEADVILRQRLPGLHHKCRMAVLLYNNSFIQLPDDIMVAELYNFTNAWPSEPLDACAWPPSPHRIRVSLTDIQIEYFKEQIQIQRIEFSHVFIVVGIIGGLAVVALAISIFWGLNGSSFVSK